MIPRHREPGKTRRSGPRNKLGGGRGDTSFPMRVFWIMLTSERNQCSNCMHYFRDRWFSLSWGETPQPAPVLFCYSKSGGTNNRVRKIVVADYGYRKCIGLVNYLYILDELLETL
jgi:hypothetical protein